MSPTPPTARPRFIARENRFVVRAELPDGEVVRAHLPNTARLHDLLTPGAPLRLEPSTDPRRRTAWTVTRVWDGTWVALVADAASGLIADHLEGGGTLAGWPAVAEVRREVAHGGHRFDLEVVLADGRSGVVEVKSLSRVVDRVAPLSSTPSARGVRHLAVLARRAGAGEPAAVAFVIQRGDAAVLDLAAPADPGWRTAVRRARRAGVEVAAFACEVDERGLALGRELPVRDQGSPGAEVIERGGTEGSVAAAYAGSVLVLAAEGAAPVTIEPLPDAAGPGQLPRLLPASAHHLHIVTACNPRSRLLSRAENTARNQQLLADIEGSGMRWIAADGGAPDGSWREPGYGTIDAQLPDVLALARRYEQLAVFELTATRLRVLWTDPGLPPIEQGWRQRGPVDTPGPSEPQ